MRVLLINPPFQPVTTRYGVGSQTPLGLLLVGATILSRGHEARLLDAEARQLRIEDLVKETAAWQPSIIMTGHAGSTAAHPIIMRMARALKERLPTIPIVYGGVFPTYHAAEILRAESAIDIVVRGEGEEIAGHLIEALAQGASISDVRGIAYRERGEVRVTAPAAMIARPRRISARLGADRKLGSLSLLGARPRRCDPVLERMPASVHLLRPKGVLDEMARS